MDGVGTGANGGIPTDTKPISILSVEEIRQLFGRTEALDRRILIGNALKVALPVAARVPGRRIGRRARTVRIERSLDGGAGGWLPVRA